ncbi:Rho GTPase-activating protein 32 [Amphibalanus amphitrite]|uniref:Rho GTPase-activating protein 32 n=1 Tax=Amphibalanus amphitrite TaxID=1232801 RepID=A0A6A4VJ72_AMPAM|nr:Rho GTPase-activating protein 32 [Amphibalanus amphitrite]
MTAKNLAIVWAPNLVRSQHLELGGVAALQGIGVQAVIVEYLIGSCELVFCGRLPPLADRSYELVFCDRLPPLPDPATDGKRSRPRSLAVTSPSRLLSRAPAPAKPASPSKAEHNYIEVGECGDCPPGLDGCVVYLFSCLCLSVFCLLVCLFVCLFVCLSVCLFVCLFVSCDDVHSLARWWQQSWVMVFTVVLGLCRQNVTNHIDRGKWG